MTKKEMLSYIKGELKKGSSKEDVKNIFLKNGWDGIDVEKSINKIRIIFTIKTISVFIVLGILFSFFFNPNKEPLLNSEETIAIILSSYFLLELLRKNSHLNKHLFSDQKNKSLQSIKTGFIVITTITLLGFIVMAFGYI